MEDINKRFSIMVNNGPRIENLVEYIKEWVINNPSSKISVGTDSQQRGRYIAYATVIVLIYPNNKGGHVLYCKDYDEQLKRGKSTDGDIFVRLSGEAVRSIDVANFLSENGIKVDSIELDYQKFSGTKSSSSYSANSGWIKSLGYEVLGKDEDTVLLAVRAADGLVKPKSKKRSRNFGQKLKKVA